MKTSKRSIVFFLLAVSLLSLSPSFTFAKTPYNAVAAKLKPNTTKGVFDENDALKDGSQVSGTIWGVNGASFLIRLPKDDSGYNVLYTKETTITLNGKSTTSKSIKKGVAVTVTGTLDTSTYTFKATKIELGKIESNLAKPVEKDGATQTIKPTEVQQEKTNPVAETTKEITKPSKQPISFAGLGRGTKGNRVLALQQKLIDLKFLSNNAATGTFGPVTEKALKAFQKAHKLTTTGNVGPKTAAALEK